MSFYRIYIPTHRSVLHPLSTLISIPHYPLHCSLQSYTPLFNRKFIYLHYNCTPQLLYPHMYSHLSTSTTVIHPSLSLFTPAQLYTPLYSYLPPQHLYTPQYSSLSPPQLYTPLYPYLPPTQLYTPLYPSLPPL